MSLRGILYCQRQSCTLKTLNTTLHSLGMRFHTTFCFLNHFLWILSQPVKNAVYCEHICLRNIIFKHTNLWIIIILSTITGWKRVCFCEGPQSPPGIQRTTLNFHVRYSLMTPSSRQFLWHHRYTISCLMENFAIHFWIYFFVWVVWPLN